MSEPGRLQAGPARTSTARITVVNHPATSGLQEAMTGIELDAISGRSFRLSCMGLTGPAGGLLADALRREGRVVQIRRGQALFVEGDRAERVFLVQKGWVLLSCAGPGGREVVLGLSGPGDVIGELSAFDEQPRSASAVAAAEVEAVVASSQALARALNDLDVSHELIAVLAGRLRNDTRKLVEFATLSTMGRISWRLVELAERYGEQTRDGVAVSLPISQDQLASWCGASREAAVRSLRALRTVGIITTGRQSVVIRDLDALRRRAQGLA